MSAPHEEWVAEPAAPDVLAARAKSASTARRVQVRCAASIKPAPINWLWPGWLPSGKLTILAGNAGAGKTTLALGLAAALTAGDRWPDGVQCRQRRNVLIWSGEDAAEDTIVPRLIAAGADIARCHVIEGVAENGVSVAFDPAQDIADLSQTMARIGGAGLLIIDPIVNAIAGDMHKANDVRRGLQAVVDFAALHDCAVLGITHFAKGSTGRAPQERVLGSQAFGALARMVLVAAKEETGERRVLARAKSNIADDCGGVAYSIESADIEGGIGATRAKWEGLIEGTAREILGEIEQWEADDTAERKDAVEFLRGLLADGPVGAKQVRSDAEDAGYAWMTVRRAQRTLGVIAQKEGGRFGDVKQRWYWSLP
jgi:putative DNA primase/helicase